MLSKLRPRSIYDVMAAIACFVALAGGTAYAADTIRTGDIVDNQVFTTDVRDDTLGFGGLQRQDLGPGSVRASEIHNGSLNDEDISEGTFVNFTTAIGRVPAHTCREQVVTGVNAQGDHLLLTPNFNTMDDRIIYSAEYQDSDEWMRIQACNPTGGEINDGTTRFNLLVIDAR
jgi:hypothetical protein